MRRSPPTLIIIPNPKVENWRRNFVPPAVESIGCYSRDSDQNFVDGTAALEKIKLFEGVRAVRYDLNQGVDLDQWRAHESEFMPWRREQNSKLVHFLHWIRLHEEDFKNRGPDFVMLRGVMKRIVTTPYRDTSLTKWCLGAIKKNGTIYFRNILKKTSKPIVSVSDARSAAWGHNFEKFVTSGEGLKGEPAVTESRVVVQTKIRGHSILLSAELDAISEKAPDDNLVLESDGQQDILAKCKLVELKTCTITQQDKSNHAGFRKHKSRKWWIQAAIGGVSNVVAGYRDDNGVVSQIENIPVEDLYRKYSSDANGNRLWEPETGYYFVGNFLSEVKRRVTRDDAVYLFSFEKDQQRGESVSIAFEIQEQASEYMLELI